MSKRRPVEPEPEEELDDQESEEVEEEEEEEPQPRRKKPAPAPPPPSKKGKPAAKSGAGIPAKSWQDMLDQLSTSGSFFRPKEGKTRIRLVLLPEMEPDPQTGVVRFYAEARTTFRGKEKMRYVLPAVVLEAKGMRPEMASKVTPVIVSKTVIKGILSLLAEGYDLFDADEGFGISINRSGQGLDTDYSVLASRAAVPLPDDLEDPEKTLDEMAQEFEEWSAKSGQSSSDDDGGDDEEIVQSRTAKRNRRSEW